MPKIEIGRLGAEDGPEELIDAMAKLQKSLDYLLNISGLDSKNIRAQSIIADRMDVNELSAISANLGHITAGLIEAVTVIASTITGGVINGTEINGSVINGANINGGNINVTSDVHIGRKLFMNETSFFSDIVFEDGVGYIYYDPAGNSLNVIADYFKVNGTNILSTLSSIQTSISTLFSLYSSLDSRVSALESAGP